MTGASIRRWTGWLVVFGLLAFSGCQTELDPGDLERALGGRVEPLFNQNGTRNGGGWDPLADDLLVQMIDSADATIDFAIMGFSREVIVDALVRAHHRGVRLRFVGDGRHLEGGYGGYGVMDALEVPSMSGNMYHIMHNKFWVFDSRFVVTGTGNITPTGYERNDNNWVYIDSPVVASDFTDEFEQLFSGRFGHAKRPIDNGNTYDVGDTTVEVWFSPQEDAMGRILEAVEQAQESIYFYIFAFTKDQLGSAYVDAHLRFSLYNECCDPALEGARDASVLDRCAAEVTCADPFVRREVRGVIDRSQLHSNGPYHEAYRLLTFGVPIRMDGNVNSRTPGDYQAGGGRQHAKTMVIDPGTPNARVLTGSFNWSASATVANDETLLVLHGERVADQFMEQFDRLWQQSDLIGEDYAGPAGTIEEGDVIFNEIHWDGWNGDNDPTDFGGDDVSNDEFIELLNTTDRPIDLSMWTISSDTDFVMGLFPGTIIGPRERFLILDHNLEPFSDLEPQAAGGAFLAPDFVMNVANDQRLLRLNLRNAQFRLRLLDPRGNLIDGAGDGGPPFAGGRQRGRDGVLRNYSMERVHYACDGGGEACSTFLPGDDPDAWEACGRERGGENVREEYRDIVIATPGAPNSGGEQIGAEEAGFRAPADQE